MATWDGLRPVADASHGAFHQGNALQAEALLEKVGHGLLPTALSSSQTALTDALKSLRKCGYWSCQQQERQ